MATIIKRESQVHNSGTNLSSVAYDLSDMASQADEYLNTVRQEAAKIIQEAKQEAIQVRQQAEQAGRQAAEEAVEAILDKKVAEQMRTLSPAIARAVQLIEDSRNDWMRHWEASAVKIACAIASRIVQREITQQPEITLNWIRETLQLAAGSAELTLRIHPDNHKTLGRQIEELTKVFGGIAPTQIVADETLSPHGCVISTEFGTLDMQLETQLDRIAEELS